MIYNDIRRPKRELAIGSVSIGGKNRIAIQSMTNTFADDIESTVAQIAALQYAGCDIVRITVPNKDAASTIIVAKEKGITVPIVADIHFDYKLALLCADYGVDKIRINPGNIGSDEKIREVCKACNIKNIPIRIGVNGGSLEKHILQRHGAPTAAALCESAMYHAELLRKFDFNNIAVSIKSSDVKTMIDANVMLSELCDYPLHLGVTEAGAGKSGLMKSSAGIGALLCNGIGDTIRISLTDNPLEEVSAARELLTALNIEGQKGMNIVSCPTCGRTSVNLISLYDSFSAAVAREGLNKYPLTVALMGCAVNGPGEAREADIGVAGGQGEMLLFKRGIPTRKIAEDNVVDVLINEIKDIIK